MCGQSIVYNIYATLANTNLLFMGFSCSQNVSFSSQRDSQFYNSVRLTTFQKSILHLRTFCPGVFLMLVLVLKEIIFALTMSHVTVNMIMVEDL